MTDSQDPRRIDGKAIAAKVQARVAEAVADLSRQHGFQPGLAVVLVGEDPASQVYVRSKGKRTIESGMRSIEHKLPRETGEAELLALVHELNADDAVDGILVQLPLPGHIDSGKVLDAIDPAKDVDGFHAANVGRLWSGADALVPCTPLGSLLLLKDRLGSLSGKDALVVGRSNIVGKPMAALLLRESATVTVAHSRSRDLPELCRRADILVAAVGRPKMIPGEWVKAGSTVIDVGINRINAGDGKSRLVGDVDYETALPRAGAITPVPGGVGPMTIAMLLCNTVTAACRRRGIAPPDWFA